MPVSETSHPIQWGHTTLFSMLRPDSFGMYAAAFVAAATIPSLQRPARKSSFAAS